MADSLTQPRQGTAADTPSVDLGNAVARGANSECKVAEPLRVVVYLTDRLEDLADTIAKAGAYAHGRDWRVVNVRNDADPAEVAWFRLGLLSAITIVCHGQADGVVMYEADYDELTSGDQSWLLYRLTRYDGFLQLIPMNTAIQGTPMTKSETASNGLNWHVRYTWECSNGVTYPQHTYNKVASESRAIAEVAAGLNRLSNQHGDLRLVAVHWRHVDSEEWATAE